MTFERVEETDVIAPLMEESVYLRRKKRREERPIVGEGMAAIQVRETCRGGWKRIRECWWTDTLA